MTSTRPLLLACEDEERIIELLRTLCEPLGVDVLGAKDGATALMHLAARRPALMTLDLVLPNLDGFAVLERVRQRKDLEDMPILVISALGDPANVRRAYAMGVVDFVAKPFNVDLLDAKLKVFLRLRRLQDELKTRERFLEEVVDHVSSGLMVADAAGTIVKVNHAGALAIGREANELMGRTIGEALPGAEAMFLVSGDATQRRVTIQTNTGERTLGFTNATVEVDGGHGAVAVFRELSDVEVARREREERKRWDELVQSAKSFVHEVRNPLTAIGTAAQVIARDEIDAAVRQRLARAIESESMRVVQLVAEYVEHSEVPPMRRSVEVPQLFAEVVEVNLLHSPAQGRIAIECDTELPSVKMDPARLKQVVLNLLLNAVKATEAAGAITLSARRDAGGVAVRVSDTGCGIPAGDLPRIFDESFSTRGGGLGLPIARKIVESHGGAIRVESEHGSGTTFTVWLPAA